MHKASYETMERIIHGMTGNALNVLDVGSLNVNGTYRPIIEERGWRYTGLDVVPGNNVDIVALPFDYPIDDDAYDVVISGSAMEHVTAIWLWVPELVRVLKPGGTLVIYTHHAMIEHRYPVDCWRIMRDGMAFLFDSANLVNQKIEYVNDHDIVGIGEKSA